MSDAPYLPYIYVVKTPVIVGKWDTGQSHRNIVVIEKNGGTYYTAEFEDRNRPGKAMVVIDEYSLTAKKRCIWALQRRDDSATF